MTLPEFLYPSAMSLDREVALRDLGNLHRIAGSRTHRANCALVCQDERSLLAIIFAIVEEALEIDFLDHRVSV